MTTPSAALQDLLEAIIANPADDGARLVYADALTSMGDPRGEFIVVQVALAPLGVSMLGDFLQMPDALSDADAVRASVLWRRQQELLAAHARAWAQALIGDQILEEDIRFGYRRGFACGASIDGPRSTRVISQLIERRAIPPIEEILLTDEATDADVDRLLEAGVFTHLIELEIATKEVGWGAPISAQAFERLVGAAPRLERIIHDAKDSDLGEHLTAVTSALTSLELSELNVEDVMHAPCMRSLRRLQLTSGGSGALDFLDVSICPNLEHVEIGSSRDHFDVPDPFEVSSAFKNRATLPKLKRLCLNVEDENVLYEMLDSKTASTIEELEMSKTVLSPRLWEAVTASPSITKVDFGFKEVDSLASLLAVGSASRKKSFEKFCINFSSSIDERSLIALLEQNPALAVLSLGRPHHFPDESFGKADAPPVHSAALLNVLARHAPESLRWLSLSRWDFSNDDDIAALVSAPQLSKLRALHLQGGRMSDGGARAVSEASMPALVTLALRYNAFSEQGKNGLREAQARFPALTQLLL